MNSWLIHPRYFAAWAAAAGIGASDPNLSKGTHLRLFPSAALGFPLALFLLWRVDAFEPEPLPMAWLLRNGRAIATPDLDLAGGLLQGWRQGEPPNDSLFVLASRRASMAAAATSPCSIVRAGASRLRARRRAGSSRRRRSRAFACAAADRCRCRGG